jgi:hypothetical protein
MTSKAHLVGSVNMSSAEEVLRAIGERVGDVAARIPDGETGERLAWAQWQVRVLSRQRALETTEAEETTGIERPRFRLRAGASVDDLDLENLGYADEAIRSYATFSSLRTLDIIPDGPRFLVSLPTPSAVASAYFVPEDRAAIAVSYERALLGEVARIADAMPASDLAIQWDAPGEVAHIEGVIPHYYADGGVETAVVSTLARLCEGVPREAEVGVHLCYGDTGDVDNPEGSHWKNPDDLSVLTRMMNGTTERSSRSITYFHVPVPIRRDDEAYFAPLAELALDPSTTVSLGLVHREDGVAGALRRIRSARVFIQNFDIATECGLGRERNASILRLLSLHREILTDPGFADGIRSA